jgi:CubicO group peptidase (beta-lactamase class C family)
MMLYEEGKFLLDDPIAKYIPTFTDQRALAIGPRGDTSLVPVKRPATVRQLFNHTSGLSYPIGGGYSLYGKEGVTVLHTFGLDGKNEKLSDVIPRMGRVPLIHEPGARYSYGFSVDVLGYLVEVWSGMSLDEFLRRRIFEPLGMEDTYFNIPEAKAHRVTSFFRLDSAGMVSQQAILRFPDWPDTLPLDYPIRPKLYFGGGGGLSSTIFDYAVFLQMLLNGGEYHGVRLLSPNTIRMMTMNSLGELSIDSIGTKFGLGFSVATDRSSTHHPAPAGTFAWGGALGTTYWVDPTNNLIGLLYRQSWGPDRAQVGDKFPVLVYQALVD